MIVAPPLVITHAEIDELMSKVVRSLDDLHHELRHQRALHDFLRTSGDEPGVDEFDRVDLARHENARRMDRNEHGIGVVDAIAGKPDRRLADLVKVHRQQLGGACMLVRLELVSGLNSFNRPARSSLSSKPSGRALSNT